MPGVMSKAHIDGFLDEIKRVNPGFAESKSSLMGLLRHLRNSSANPAVMILLQARQFCVNPNDRRLPKYDIALRHLVSVWATVRPYPGRILAAVAVVRQFNWVHMTPWPSDWMSRGTFNFDPTRWRENAAYTGPYRDQFLPMVRPFLQDQTNRAFPH